MEKAIVPNHIEAELSKRGVPAVDEARGQIAAWLLEARSRAEIVAELAAQGYGPEAASWLYTQVKDKGAEFELVFVGTSKVQTALQARASDRFKKNLGLGAALWIVGFGLSVLAIFIAVNNGDSPMLVFVPGVILRTAGLWLFAEAKGYDRFWGLSSILFVDIVVLFFVALVPKRD